MEKINNLIVLGNRKIGLGALYFFTLVMGILIIALSILTREDIAASVFSSIAGIIAIIGSITVLINYYKTPKIAITYDGQSTIYVKKQAIRLTDITNVSYRRASARGIQYRWGSVTIRTISSEYKVRFLEDCEMVEKNLTKLMYKKP